MDKRTSISVRRPPWRKWYPQDWRASQQIGTDGSLQILELAGREEWAPSHLMAASGTGCTTSLSGLQVAA
jgi:hypothetical protein